MLRKLMGAVLLAGICLGGSVWALDTPGDITTPNTIDDSSAGIFVDGGNAIYFDGGSAIPIPHGGTINLGGDIDITAAAGSLLGAGVSSNNSTLKFDMDGYGIDVIGAATNQVTIGYFYDSTDGAFTGSIVGGGDIYVDARAGAGAAAGLMFVNNFMQPGQAFAEIGGTIDVGYIEVLTGAGSTATARGVIGGNLTGNLTTGDIVVSSAYNDNDNGDDTDDTGGAVAVQVGTIRGSLTVDGNISVQSGESEEGNASHANGIDIVGVAQGGSVVVTGAITATSGESAVGQSGATRGFVASGDIAGKVDLQGVMDVTGGTDGDAHGFQVKGNIASTAEVTLGEINVETIGSGNAFGVNISDDGVYGSVASGALILNGDIYAEATGTGAAYGIFAGQLVNQEIGFDVIAEGATAYGIWTTGEVGGDDTVDYSSKITIVDDVGIKGSTADIRMDGLNDTLVFDVADGYGQDIITEGAENIIAKGMYTDFYDNSVFTGTKTITAQAGKLGTAVGLTANTITIESGASFVVYDNGLTMGGGAGATIAFKAGSNLIARGDGVSDLVSFEIATDTKLDIDPTARINVYTDAYDEETGALVTNIKGTVNYSPEMEAAIIAWLADQSVTTFYQELVFEYDATANNGTISLITNNDNLALDPSDIFERLDGMGYNAGLVGLDSANNMLRHVEAVDDHGMESGYFDETDSGIVNDEFYYALGNNLTGFSATLNSGETVTFNVTDAWLDQKNGGTVRGTVAVAQRATLDGADTTWKVNQNYVQAFASALQDNGGDYAMASRILNSNYLNRFWVRGVGIWEDADRKGARDGYKYDGYGFQTGYDRIFGPMIVGASFAYTTGDYEDKIATRHDSDIDNYNFNLYATYVHCSGFFATVQGGYTHSKNDINEYRGNWVREDYDTDTLYLGAKLGYVWRPNANFTLLPSAGLAYIDSRAKSHVINTNGVDTEGIGRAKANSGMLPIELRGVYTICFGADSKLDLGINGGYTYMFDDDSPSSWTTDLGALEPWTPVRNVNHKYGKSQWNIGASAKVTAGRFDVGVNYDYFSRSKSDGHRLMGTLGISF